MIQYYNSQLFLSCIEHVVPQPSILYWGVRAVFALYGPMIDSGPGKPLFTKKCWKKADGVLKEILLGLYSDLPGTSMYTKKLKNNSTVMKNKYGMIIIECHHGTNQTENYHKNLTVTFGHWHTGVETSDYLLAERRHRHNHRCSEHRRFGFPILGHYDTWLIDQIQNLVLQNQDTVCYQEWSNASDYKETAESFDSVAIQNSSLHKALIEQWENKIDVKV
jgi:hypothetical protein